MIQWAINGISVLARELDPDTECRSATLLELLAQLKDQHTVAWFRTFCERLYFTINRYPNEDWHIALSEFQLRSKLAGQRMLDQYCLSNKTVCYQGSWLGLGPLMLLCQHDNVKVEAYDIDGPTNRISAYLCSLWNYDAENRDVMALNYDYPVYVNLITEHLEDIGAWKNTLPKGAIVLASNTDLPDRDHYSTCNSLEEFLIQLGVLVPLSTEVVTAYREDGTAMNRWLVLFAT